MTAIFNISLPMSAIMHRINIKKIKTKVIGAEDNSLFYGPDGIPIFLFTLNSKELKSMRHLWAYSPISSGIWSDKCRKKVSNFKKPIELGGFPGINVIEKNWTPFIFKNTLFFQQHLFPRSIFKSESKLNGIYIFN